MSAVTLELVWLHLASDLSQALAVDLRPGLSSVTTAPGEVRAYAGGRRRAIRREGVDRTATFQGARLSRAEVEWLEDWLGLDVLFRDPRGSCFVAVFWSLEPTWSEVDEVADVTLTVTRTTDSEAV